MKGGKIMKKNLIFGMFLLGIVLMSSFAFAGITGYAITLSKAPVLDDNLGEASVTDVSRTGVATVEVTNPQTGTAETFFGRPGQTLTTSSGVQFTVQSATPGSLFKRTSAEISVVIPTAGGEINVVPSGVSPVAGIASGSGSVTSTGQCINSCQWRFNDINVTYGSGAGVNSDCFSGEIAIEGSCNGEGTNIVSNHVSGPLSGANGNGWHCQYNNDIPNGPPIVYTETGVLCCKV